MNATRHRALIASLVLVAFGLAGCIVRTRETGRHRGHSKVHHDNGKHKGHKKHKH